jgi:HPt (histidine-containing phosphotransfer) domain-containing protein
MQPASKNPKLVIQADPDLADIIPGYLEARLGDLSKLEAALARSDSEAIAIMGHKMRGTGTSYGFQGISEIGFRLEKAALAGDVTGMTTSIQEMKAYMEALDVHYPAAAA